VIPVLILSKDSVLLLLAAVRAGVRTGLNGWNRGGGVVALLTGCLLAGRHYSSMLAPVLLNIMVCRGGIPVVWNLPVRRVVHAQQLLGLLGSEPKPREELEKQQDARRENGRGRCHNDNRQDLQAEEVGVAKKGAVWSTRVHRGLGKEASQEDACNTSQPVSGEHVQGVIDAMGQLGLAKLDGEVGDHRPEKSKDEAAEGTNVAGTRSDGGEADNGADETSQNRGPLLENDIEDCPGGEGHTSSNIRL